MRRVVLSCLPVAPTLAELDSRARSWPWPCRAAYLTLKWSLVGLGVYLVLGLAVQQWRAGEFGLGIGFVTAVLFAVIIGVVNAVRGGSSDPSSPRQTAPK